MIIRLNCYAEKEAATLFTVLADNGYKPVMVPDYNYKYVVSFDTNEKFNWEKEEPKKPTKDEEDLLTKVYFKDLTNILKALGAEKSRILNE